MSIQKQVVESFVNSWRWNHHEECLVRKWILGSSIHICCGMSKVGDIRFDIESSVKPDILGDILHNDLQSNFKDSVISDPPWNLGFTPRYWKELKRIAKKRIIVISLSQMMEGRDWHKTHEEVIKRQNGFQVKVLTVYDRQSHNLESFTNETTKTLSRKCG